MEKKHKERGTFATSKRREPSRPSATEPLVLLCRLLNAVFQALLKHCLTTHFKTSHNGIFPPDVLFRVAAEREF